MAYGGGIRICGFCKNLVYRYSRNSSKNDSLHVVDSRMGEGRAA